MKILEAARDLFLSGVGWGLRDNFKPPGNGGWYERRLGRGSHPLTHMLRGKFWLHKNRPGTQASDPIEPPRIYRTLAAYWSHSTFNAFRDGLVYTPGFGPDRHYLANISAEEFIVFENVTNQGIEDLFFNERPSQRSIEDQHDEDYDIGRGLTDENGKAFKQFLNDNRLDPLLEREFPNIPVIKLPVLFDSLNVWHRETTLAFTPDVVNMQQHGNHVYVPRPYGPRMRIDDAITVLTTVMSDLDPSFRTNLNRRALIRRKLNETWHWHNGGTANSSSVPIRDISKIFRDGFVENERPMNMADIDRRILRNRRNSGKFSGTILRRGWQKIFIPENNVDLFEAYTQLVLERLGLTVHWVDTWHYHTHSGAIHCGTNAIRHVQVSSRNAWWNHPLINVDRNDEETSSQS